MEEIDYEMFICTFMNNTHQITRVIIDVKQFNFADRVQEYIFKSIYKHDWDEELKIFCALFITECFFKSQKIHVKNKKQKDQFPTFSKSEHVRKPKRRFDIKKVVYKQK